MYQQIWQDYLSKRTPQHEGRTLHMGQALRFIREEARETRANIGKKAEVGLSLLKAMETKKEAYSTWQKTLSLASSLDIPIEKLIQRSREEFPYNFFVQRKNARLTLEYDGVNIFPLSPPISTQSDFFIAKVHIEPRKKMSPCTHLQISEIAGYIMEGPLTLRFGNERHELKANQSFFFDGSVEHEFINDNDEKTIEFYLCLNPTPTSITAKEKPQPHSKDLDLAFALEYVRKKVSPAPSIPLPWNMLSEMTGLSMRALTHLKSGKTEIVYWDKLEAISQGTGIPLEEIIAVASGKSDGRIEICTALYRGYLDYSDQFGIKIYSAARPGTARRKFFIGQIFLDKRSVRHALRRRWRYKTNAFACLIVQDGRILMEYGDRKKETLTTGDSVYFDANLEFRIHNLEHQTSKVFMFSTPPLF